MRLNDKNWTAKTVISENSFDSVVIEAVVQAGICGKALRYELAQKLEP